MAQRSIDPWTETAIEQNRGWLKAYVLSLTGSPWDSDDIVQEVFQVAYRKWSALTPGSNFGGWLRGIARNLVLEHCRRNKRVVLMDPDDAVTYLDRIAARSEERSMDPFYAKRRKRMLRECMQTLTERTRKLVALRYAAGYSMERIAQAVNSTISAVNVAIFRARRTLTECVRRKQMELSSEASS